MRIEKLETMLAEKNIKYDFGDIDGQQMLFIFAKEVSGIAKVYKFDNLANITEEKFMESILKDTQEDDMMFKVKAIAQSFMNFTPEMARKLYLCLNNKKQEISRKIFDFYVCVRLYDGDYSAIIHRNILQKWGISEEILFKIAEENTHKLDKAFFKMDNLLKIEFDTETDNHDNPLYVLRYDTDKFGCGATIILNNIIMNQVWEELQENYYIIPSSIHEVLLLPQSSDVCSDELKIMVKEVNDSAVVENERLSYSIFFFEKNKGLQSL